MQSGARIIGGLIGIALAAAHPGKLGAQVQAITAEAAVARSIEDRSPVDTGSVFPSDVGVVWLWTRVAGAAGQTISHVWRHEDMEWVVELPVGGSPWRTFSSKTIPPEWTGEWSVEVRDADGRVVKRMTFRVTDQG